MDNLNRSKSGKLFLRAWLAAFAFFAVIAPGARAEEPEEPAETAKQIYEKGLLAMDKGNFDEAIAFFERVSAIKPDIPEIHNVIGIANLEKKTIGTAVREFEEAIRLDPAFADPYNNLGIIYSGHINDLELAEDYFKKAVELKPDFSRAYFGLGWLYLTKKHNVTEGAKYLEKAVEYDPRHAEAHYFLGIAYVTLGDRHKALRPISMLRTLGRNDMAQTIELLVEQESSVVKEKVFQGEHPMEQPPAEEGAGAQAPANGAGSAPSLAAF